MHMSLPVTILLMALTPTRGTGLCLAAMMKAEPSLEAGMEQRISSGWRPDKLENNLCLSDKVAVKWKRTLWWWLGELGGPAWIGIHDDDN